VKFQYLFFQLATIIFFSDKVLAQQTLLGKVQDPLGEPVAARVSLYRAGRLAAPVSTTSPAGEYRFEGLGEGDYSLDIEAVQFRRVVRPVSLTGAGQAKREDVELSLAGLTQTMVVTASGEAQTIDQTARAVSVVPGDEIQDRNEYTLSEILRNLPGVQIRTLGGPGALTQVRLRGLRPDATAVLVDGMRFRDPSALQGDSSTLFSSLTFVNANRVEVQRGGSSSLYGTNAAGGAVNIISEAGGGPTQGTIQVEGGGLGFLRARAAVSGGWRDNRWTYSAGFTHLNVRHGVDGNDQNLANAAQGMLGYQLSVRTKISGRFYGSHDYLQNNIGPTTGGIPGANFAATGIIPAVPLEPAQLRNLIGGRPVDYGNATFIPGRDDPDSDRSLHFISSGLRLQHEFSRRVHFQSNYQLVTTDRKFENGPGGVGFQPTATTLSLFNGNIHTLDSRLTVDASRWYSFTGGYEFEHESYRDRQNNNLPSPRTILVDGRIRQNSHAGFAVNQFRLLRERLQISLTGRVQDFALSTPIFEARGVNNVYNRIAVPSPPRAWTGDVAIAYFIPKIGMKLRSHGGNAYRAPALYERFGGGFSANQVTGNINFTPYGDPRLAPDRYNTYDIGVDQYFLGSRARVSATYFYTRIKQLTAFDFSGRISAATDPYGRTAGYLNGQGGLSRGAELGYEARLSRSTTVQGSYTFTNAVNDRDVQVGGFWGALTTPRHTASFLVSQRVGKRVDLTFDLFRSGQYYLPFFAVNRTRVFLSPGFTKGDLVAGYRLWSRDRSNVRLYGKVENVFNQRWYENGWLVPQAWALVGLSYAF